MNARTAIVAAIALVALTILSITMLLIGQTVTAVVTLIPSVAFGFQQIVSAVNTAAPAVAAAPTSAASPAASAGATEGCPSDGEDLGTRSDGAQQQ
ncbi:hypothetical protein [Streptomyces sp. NPDC006879]|uniref:hypothetical protein n=1 Tax=Streptomyces sp. NPDC006879 TaxID=3364767 RepID=UPI0036A1E42B